MTEINWSDRNAVRATLMAILEGMRSKNEWKNEVHLYIMVTQNWPTDLLVRVTQHLLYAGTTGDDWRPTTAGLTRIAAQMLYTAPDEQAVLEEILFNASAFGTHAKPAPSGRGRIPGDPDWTHPIVGDVVSRLGGWMAVCAWDERAGGVLARRVEEAYAKALERLTLDTIARMRSDDYRAIEARQTPQIAPVRPVISLPPPPSGEEVPMPAEVRDRLQRLDLNTYVQADSVPSGDRQSNTPARLAQEVEGWNCYPPHSSGWKAQTP